MLVCVCVGVVCVVYDYEYECGCFVCLFMYTSMCNVYCLWMCVWLCAYAILADMYKVVYVTSFYFFNQLEISETPDFLAFFLNSEHFYSMRGDL